MINKYIGIDPGKTGGICILNESGDIENIYPMPSILIKSVIKKVKTGKHKGEKRLYKVYDIDFREVLEIICANERAFTMIEAQTPFSKQGLATTSVTMKNYGDLDGMLKTIEYLYMERPYEIVTGSKWKTYYKKKYGKSIKEKPVSCALASQLSGRSFILPRCTTPHDGMAESYLIARYGYLKKNNLL